MPRLLPVFGGFLGFLCGAATLVAAPSLVSGRQNTAAPATAAGHSTAADVSPDGRFVVFLSSARDLAPAQVRGRVVNLYLRDRLAGTTTLITQGRDGRGADGQTLRASFVAGGTRLLFESRARNLTPEPVSGRGDIFLHELAGGETQLVSRNHTGTAGGQGRSESAVATPDGRFVVFVSQARDLVTNDANRASDIFVRDLDAGTTRLVTIDARGVGSSLTTPPAYATDLSFAAAISPDGRFVVFASYATDLVFGVSSSSQRLKVYARDLENATTQVISLNRLNQISTTGDSWAPTLVGTNVFFVSSAPDLTATNVTAAALYRRSLSGGPTVRVSTDPGTARAAVQRYQVTPDGRHAAYLFGTGSTTVPNNVRRWTAATGEDLVISLNTNGAASSGPVLDFRLADDGASLAFLSAASDLLAGVEGGWAQVFVRSIPDGPTHLVSRDFGGHPAGADSLTLTGDAYLQTVVYSAPDADQVAGDFNGSLDVFAAGVGASPELISGRAGGDPSETPFGLTGLDIHQLSDNGRYLLFSSLADDLVEQDGNGAADVFLRDRDESVTVTLSTTPEGRTANGMSWRPAMTPDARFVAFYSRATNLLPTDTNRDVDLYLRDTRSFTLTLLSAGTNGLAAGGLDPHWPPLLSPDGRMVGFVSTSPRFLAGDDATSPDLFVQDQARGELLVVSRQSGMDWSSAHVPLAISSRHVLFAQHGSTHRILSFDLLLRQFALLPPDVAGTPSFTPDGVWMAYLTPLTNSTQSIGLLNTETLGTLELVPATPSLLVSPPFVLTPDGRFLAFAAEASLVPQDTNRVTDVYVADRDRPGHLMLVSSRPDGYAGSGASRQPVLSADGRWVAFTSAASDLVGGDTNGRPDVFVRDLAEARSWLVSPSALAEGTSSDWSFAPRISAGGHVVAFVSLADDLTGRDYNNTFDLFDWPQPAPPVGDSDGDGLDDPWEVRYFGGLHRNGLLDADGDRLTDRAEFLAGTSPVDAASVLRLECHLGPASAPPYLEWPGDTNRRYRVEFREDLVVPGWQTLPGTPESSGAGRMQQRLESLPSPATRYYRLVLEP